MTLDPSALPPLDHTAPGTPLRILSTKFDGSPHYEYWGRLIDQHAGVIRVITDAGTPTRSYRGEGLMRSRMTQLFFTDRWYNVFHNYEPVGRLGMHWYANVGTPARIEGDTLHWVDLDLDLMHTQVRGLFVDDEDEFAEHQVLMSYPPEVVSRVLEARDELLEAAWSGSFPFDRASHLPR
jgi:protein associated with RNAse G/E